MLRVSEITVTSKTDESGHALNFEDVTFHIMSDQGEMHVKIRSSKSRDIGVLASGLWRYFLRNPSNNLEIIKDLVLSMRSSIYEHDLSLIY
jgi:hypothetical protein